MQIYLKNINQMQNEKPRKEVNPVADMMNWNEVIRKETRNNRIYDRFMIHPTSSSHDDVKSNV